MVLSSHFSQIFPQRLGGRRAGRRARGGGAHIAACCFQARHRSKAARQSSHAEAHPLGFRLKPPGRLEAARAYRDRRDENGRCRRRCG